MTNNTTALGLFALGLLSLASCTQEASKDVATETSTQETLPEIRYYMLADT